jgi:hypothetical protein
MVDKRAIYERDKKRLGASVTAVQTGACRRSTKAAQSWRRRHNPGNGSDPIPTALTAPEELAKISRNVSLQYGFSHPVQRLFLMLWTAPTQRR